MRTENYIKQLDEATIRLLEFFKDKNNIQNYLINESKTNISKFLRETFNISWHSFEIICYERLGLRQPTKEEVRLRTCLQRSVAAKDRWKNNHDELITKRSKTLLERYGRTDVGQFGSEEFKKAMLDKYGVTCAIHIDGMSEKIAQHCLEKYGVTSYLATEDSRNKCKEVFKQNHDELVSKRAATNLAKYGDEVYTRTAEFKEKSKQSCISKFGVEYAMQSAEFKEAWRNNFFKKYNVENPSQLDKVKEQKNQTCLDHFGVEIPMQADEIKQKLKDAWAKKSNEEIKNIQQKRKKTCKYKYGVEYFTQTFMYINKKNFKKYKADDILLDSFPELCFYLYNKNLGLKILRNPVKFEYEFNGQLHYCFPDFQVESQLFEIKGNHLYEKMLVENTCDNAKLTCLIQHNVKLLLKEDYQMYIDWFNNNNYKKEDYIV